MCISLIDSKQVERSEKRTECQVALQWVLEMGIFIYEYPGTVGRNDMRPLLPPALFSLLIALELMADYPLLAEGGKMSLSARSKSG